MSEHSEDLAAVDNRGEAVHSSYDEWWCPTDERWVLDPGPCPDGSTHEPRAGLASPSLRRRAMAEDFDRERLARRLHEGLASFSPVVNGWARDLASALSEVDRLLAEVERLRKVENDALWLARLACGSSWPMEMAQGVEGAAARVRAAFSGNSPAGEVDRG